MGARPAAAGAGTAVDGDLSVAVNFDYEQAGELKIGQVGIANLRIRTMDVERLVQDAAIVRHRGKIESTINNARRVLELRREFGSLARYVWQYEPSAADRPAVLTLEAARTLTSTAASVALSKDLKKRGWSFVGPTTVYAFMQAMGLVNDHLEGCHARAKALQARAAFAVPRG